MVIEKLDLDYRGCGTGNLNDFQQSVLEAGCMIEHTTAAQRRKTLLSVPLTEQRLWRRRLKVAETVEQRREARRELHRYRRQVVKAKRTMKMDE
eukprot:9753209-Karenia_brevis.AAC.1